MIDDHPSIIVQLKLKLMGFDSEKKKRNEVFVQISTINLDFKVTFFGG